MFSPTEDKSVPYKICMTGEKLYHHNDEKTFLQLHLEPII